MSPEAGYDNRQFNEFSLDNLRRIVHGDDISNIGHLYAETEKHVKVVINSYLHSSNYSQTITNLLDSAQNLDVNKEILAMKFRQGLRRTIRLSYKLAPELSEENLKTMVNEYVNHCSLTTKSFNRIQCGSESRGTFYSIIQYPDLYQPNILEQIPTSGDKEYLTPPILRYLITNHTRNIDDAIANNKAIFYELINDPNISRSITVNNLRMFVSQRKDPLTNKDALLDPKKKEKKKSNVRKIERSLASLEIMARGNKLSLEEQNSLRKKILATYNLLSQNIIQRGVDTTLHNFKSKKTPQHLLPLDHPFLKKQTLLYYINKYGNEFGQHIEESIAMYNSLQEKYADNTTFGIEAVINQAVKIREEKAQSSIDNYLKIMKNPYLKEKYSFIPESLFFNIVSKFIHTEVIDMGELIKELKKEAKNW
jgi:hypothetical protein